MERHISIVLAERIVELLQESEASEAQRLMALDVAKVLVPVLPKASYSPEANPVDGFTSQGRPGVSSSPEPTAQVEPSIGELFEACLELASLRARHRLDVDRVLRSLGKSVRGQSPSPFPGSAQGSEAPQTPSTDAGS